jgi:hypothetical protein
MAQSVVLRVLFAVDRDPNSLDVLLSDLSRRSATTSFVAGGAAGVMTSPATSLPRRPYGCDPTGDWRGCALPW